MKVALVNLPFLFPVREEIVPSQCQGLRSISSFLKSRGNHDIHFVDALMQGFSNVRQYASGYIVGMEPHQIVDAIPPQADLIGISVPFSQLAPIGHDVVSLTKKRFPNSLVVMGGVYPSTQPRLALTSEADYIVVGEGESAFEQIASGVDPARITGVYRRGSATRESFPPADTIRDLDSLPFADYSIPNMDSYFSLSPRGSRGRAASIVTSRGCPFDCEFCSIHPIYGHRYRYRSPSHVLSEIEYLVQQHSIRVLEIEDDNFTLRKDRTIQILGGIVQLNEKGAGLTWRTPNGVRIDTLDEDVIRLIKRSGCSQIVLALEHGDPEMLQIMNKRLDLDEAFHVLELLAKHELPSVVVFFIVGYPGETRARFLRGAQYVKRIRRLSANIGVHVNIAQPYPGTKLAERCLAEGYANPGFDNFLARRDMMSTVHTVSITTPDFDVAEVLWRKYVLTGRLLKWKARAKQALPARLLDVYRAIRRKAAGR